MLLRYKREEKEAEEAMVMRVEGKIGRSSKRVALRIPLARVGTTTMIKKQDEERRKK